MFLPKNDLPSIQVYLPVSDKTVSVRPYTVKEEKILMFALEGITEKTTKKEATAIISSAANQVLSLCVNGDVDINKLPYFETELLFIKVRSISESNVLNMTFERTIQVENKPEKESYDINVNLDDIEIKFPDDTNLTGIIKLSDEVSISLRYPTYIEHEALLVDWIGEFKLSNFITSIITPDTTTKITDISEDERKELDDWCDTLTKKQMDLIYDFFGNSPKVGKSLTIDLKSGEKHTIELYGLKDFFD